MLVCIYVCMYGYVYVYVCLYICVCGYLYLCKHTDTNTRARAVMRTQCIKTYLSCVPVWFKFICIT